MTALTNWSEGVIQWLEKHCVHPEIIANRENEPTTACSFTCAWGLGALNRDAAGDVGVNIG